MSRQTLLELLIIPRKRRRLLIGPASKAQELLLILESCYFMKNSLVYILTGCCQKGYFVAKN